MATTGNFTINNTIAYSDGSYPETISWFRLRVEYNIDAVPGEQAYNVKIRCRLEADYDMRYSSLKTELSVSVDNSVSTLVGSPVMNMWSGGSGAIGDYTDWFSYKYPVTESKQTLTINVFLDLSKIYGSNSKQPGGPDYVNRPPYHFREFKGGYQVDVSGIVIGRKPALESLENNNKYNNPESGLQQNVSASTNSISIKINSSDWGDPAATAYWTCAGKSGNTKSSTFSITGLNPGTSYTISVYLSNNIGSSSTKTITIRTRNNKPITTLEVIRSDLEKMVLKWTSDKNLGNVQYKIDNGTWNRLSQTGTSGTFEAKWFEPNTTHTIYFWGRATSAYDSLEASTISKQGTTLDKAHITSIGSCIFGKSINIEIESESTKQLQLEIWTEGNSLSPRFTFTVSKGQFTFNPTQDQLDKMYRCYPKSNKIPIYFLLTTKGEWKNWNDTQQEKSLQLTGIAKTAHIGVNKSPRRCQVWWGDKNNTPHRAVMWVGDRNNNAMRTI